MAEDKATDSEKTESGSIVCVLRKPVKSFGDELKQLVFAEPTAADIAAVGLPVNLDFKTEPPRLVFEAAAMSEMMSRLAKVPSSTIAALHPKDWTNAAWMLSGFFTPDLGSAPTA